MTDREPDVDTSTQVRNSARAEPASVGQDLSNSPLETQRTHVIVIHLHQTHSPSAYVGRNRSHRRLDKCSCMNFSHDAAFTPKIYKVRNKVGARITAWSERYHCKKANLIGSLSSTGPFERVFDKFRPHRIVRFFLECEGCRSDTEDQ